MTDKETLERRIIRYIQIHGPTTMPNLSLVLRRDDGIIDNVIHGRQHYVSQAIERLRLRELIKDVEERCPHCTRAKRNRSGAVLLQLTPNGQVFNDSEHLPKMVTLRELTDKNHGTAE